MQYVDRTATLADLGSNVMYLMGFSFVLGSLCTIFILVMLELIRRHNQLQQTPAKPAKKTAAKKRK